MTVGAWFEGEQIFREDVEAEGAESEYNANAAKFICEKWDVDVDDLTPKQADWATRILDDLTERRIERRGRWGTRR